MAANQESLDRPQHLAGLLALALLALTTVLAFGRAYQQHGPTWRLVATALASLAVATLFERRSLFLASLVSAAALLLVLGLLVFPTTTWHGLALGRTLHAIRDALGHVGQQARVQVAPTPPVAPLMMAGVTAVWTAVFSAHALAVRAGSPLLAALPPAALVGFADTVLEDGARPVYAIAFLIAVLLVVFADGLRRIRQWGPVWGVSRRRISAAGQGAQRVALVAVAVAALAPGILPGFRSGALIDFSTVNRGSVHIDPFVSIRAELRRTDPVDLFRVTSTDAQGKPVPTYWRLYALDQFDGATWKSSDPEGEHARVLATPVQLAGAFPASAPVIQQRYEILADLGDRWLPMAYPPQLVQVPFGTIRFDQDLTAAMAPQSLPAGTEYVVDSRFVSPTPEELDRVSFGPPSEYGQATFVPTDVPAQVRRIAEQWTADAASPYRKVLAIQDRFLDGSFHYSVNVKPSSDANAIVTFLTKSKTGFCQQFATAMAVMVRELGLPSRVVVGFLPGTQSGTTFTVSTEQAHAWVEVLFPGYGWLPFDPTPRGPKPLATPGSYLQPDSQPSCAPGKPACGASSGSTSGADTGAVTGPARKLLATDPFRLTRPTGRRELGGVPPPAESGYLALYRVLLIVLAAIALALLAGIPSVKWLWRRAVVRRAHRPNELVLAAYRVFDGEAADLGLGRAPGETLGEHRERLRRTTRFADGHLTRLTDLATRAAYARDEVSAEDARAAVVEARAAIRDLRRGAGVARRTVGAFRPGI